MGFFDFFKVNQIKTENEALKQQLFVLQNDNQKLNQQIFTLRNDNSNLNQQLTSCKQELTAVRNIYDDLSSKTDGTKLAQLNDEISRLTESRDAVREELKELRKTIQTEQNESNTKLQAAQIKLTAANTAIRAIQKALKEDAKGTLKSSDLDLHASQMITDLELLNLNCLDIPALRKLITANKANVKRVVEKYESRYTTKANQTIYQLMVLALEAELQNVLLNLRLGALEKSENRIRELTKEYYTIASNGNQSIASTIKKFISEIEALYLESVRIEYEYYTERERIKEEQKALKEQMKQEAEERRLLEQQQKQVEKEEQKYINEIENVKNAMLVAEESEIEKLRQKLAELQSKLEVVEDKKEKIINLQNGQAGNVYIISNIGSFGENVFKVGMTRRLDPQERIDELGNASVPFPFDVHSFIFSENAVDLENKMHKILDSNRINKINRRKEFFRLDISDIEKIVHEIDPAAQFKTTALAEQYRQSQEIGKQ